MGADNSLINNRFPLSYPLILGPSLLQENHAGNEIFLAFAFVIT